MKAHLDFDLEEPEDKREFLMAANAGRAFNALWDITQYLRAQEKYGELTGDLFNKVEELRDKVHEIIYDDNCLNLEEIYL